MREIEELRKIELHSHLDCNLSYEFIRRKKHGISKIEYFRKFAVADKISGLSKYLDLIANGIALINRKNDLKFVLLDSYFKLASDNIDYCEFRFAPTILKGLAIEAEEVVSDIIEGIIELNRLFEIEAKLILCCLRNFSDQENFKVLELYKKFSQTGVVVGMDMAGDEVRYKIKPHLDFLTEVRTGNIPLTVHCGEVGNLDEIWNIVDIVKPQRLGHAISSVEDPLLLKYLKEAQIHIEVCPISNFRLGHVKRFREHPLRIMFKQNLNISINTDGRAALRNSLNDEYYYAWKYLGLSISELNRIIINARKSKFYGHNSLH